MPPASRLVLHEAPLHPDLQAALLRSLAEAREAEPLAPQYLIVPSAALAAHLARACSHDTDDVVHIRARTWEELSADLTAPERGSSGRRILAAEGNTWLARFYLARERRPPGFFDQPLGVRGFRSAILRTFGELGGAGLTSTREVEHLLVRHGAKFRPRLRHLLELYLGFRRGFESTHDDRAALLARAAQVPYGRAAQVLGTTRLWIHGWEELGPLERRLLAHLAADPGMELHVFSPLPAAGESLAVWLHGLGFSRATASPRGIASSRAREPVEYHALSAPGEESESQEIARRLLAAADDGIAFGRMAVVTRSAQQLPLLAESLAAVGIPQEHLAGAPLASTRAGRAVLHFLDLLDTGLVQAQVMAFLSVAPIAWRRWCGIADDPAPSSWERAAQSACLGHGLQDWQPKLEALRQRLDQRALRRGQENESGTPESAGSLAASELQALAVALDAVRRSFAGRARWSAFVDTLGNFLASAFVQDHDTRAVATALERLRGLEALAQPLPTRADFRELVRHVLHEVGAPVGWSAGQTLQPVPLVRHAGVTLGTAADLYGMDFDLVGLTGVQEGEWPVPIAEDPVLPDADRRVLAAALDDAGALPLRATRLERERRSFRNAAAAARRRLVVSFARLDPATGAARLPSSLLVELAEAREGRSLDYAALDRLDWLERVPIQRREPPSSGPVLSVEEHDALVIARLPRAAARRYVRRLGGFAARGRMLDVQRNVRARFTACDGLLGPRARPLLVQVLGERVYSASQLATYAACPFRFFMRHVLQVEPLDRTAHRELSQLEVGRLVHRVLELFHRGLARDGIALGRAGFARVRDHLLDALQQACAEVETAGRQGAAALWNVRKRNLEDDLVRFLRQEIPRAGAEAGWVPEHFEYRFGPGRPVAFAIPRPGREPLGFRGSIDRVDRHPIHDGVCVVDYKSGRQVARQGNPQAVQLVLYLHAVCAGDRDRLGRSEARFVYVTRRGAFEVQRLRGTAVQRRAAAFEQFCRDVADGVEAGEFFPEPGPNAARCTACDYRGVCDTRIEHQVRAKKRAGQDSRYQAFPDFDADLELLPWEATEVDSGAEPAAERGPHRSEDRDLPGGEDV